MPDNPHKLTHSVIQNSDGRYMVMVYKRGRLVGGASGYADVQANIDAAYAKFNEEEKEK